MPDGRSRVDASSVYQEIMALGQLSITAGAVVCGIHFLEERKQHRPYVYSSALIAIQAHSGCVILLRSLAGVFIGDGEEPSMENCLSISYPAVQVRSLESLSASRLSLHSRFKLRSERRIVSDDYDRKTSQYNAYRSVYQTFLRLLDTTLSCLLLKFCKKEAKKEMLVVADIC